MSEIEPVAQWETHYKGNPSCAEQMYKMESDAKSIEIDELRAAYEALKKELGYSKMAADAEAEFANEYKAKFEALKAENEAQEKRINEQDLLIKILMSTAGLLGSAEQAKKIAELEEHVTKLGSGSRQHLYQAFARRYREILSLRRENETLRKQVEILLGAAQKTVLALAHASIHDPLYAQAYDELSESINLVSKNGDSK